MARGASGEVFKAEDYLAPNPPSANVDLARQGPRLFYPAAAYASIAAINLANLSDSRRTKCHLYRILRRLANLMHGRKEDSSRDCPTFAFLSWFLRCERSPQYPGKIGQDVQLRFVPVTAVSS